MMATSSGSAHLHGRGGGGCSLHGPTEASGPQMFSTLSCVAVTSVAEQNGGSVGSVASGVGWLPPARSLQGPTEASGPQMFSTLAAWNPTDALAGVSVLVSVAGEVWAAGGSAAAAAAAAAAEAVAGVVSARLEASVGAPALDLKWTLTTGGGGLLGGSAWEPG